VASKFGGRPGEIVLDQMRAVDKSRLKKKIGPMNASTAANIKTVLATMFS
jgi:mRNA interferase MazF